MYNLKLLDFIENHTDWETLLTESPYCISIKNDGNYYIFSYSQIESDFYNDIVKECRGIILKRIKDNSFYPVCVPFFKFGNYGEGYVDSIDWSTATVQEKVDGSLIKLWYDDYWHISTNGTIDAKQATIQSDVSPYKNFYDLFMKAVQNVNLNFDKLNKNYTYMFELTSPYNRVVVPYQTISIHHIGTRDNISLDELNVDIGVPKPVHYPLHSLEECISAAQILPYNDEGYVVVDSNWHRNKIKSPAWIAVHHLQNNGIVTLSRIVELLRSGEDGEFLNYFPEYTDDFNRIKNKINSYITQGSSVCTIVLNTSFPTKKDFALTVQSQYKSYANLLFSMYDGKTSSVEEWLWKNTNDKIIQIIGEKN